MTEKQKDFLKLVVYQVYPRSFKDSNADGIGDINGITEKLDYLKELGVNAVWLSPCYKSPNEDNGYDISDYCDIMDEFGTLDDWKIMISEMHKRGIKLIMDFVANHTSSEHRWFKESRKSKDNPYRDYYYWADEPLNDWKASFGGSAWQYDETTNQYYLHSYAVGQPDLNWENPKVREEMVKVVDFWVKLGVDGFRCDVLDKISKDFIEKKNGNGPRLHEYINLLFGRPEVSHIFTVGECWGANEDNIKLLIGGDRNELSTVFQFDHMSVGMNGSKFCPEEFSLHSVKEILAKWQNIFRNNDVCGTIFFENHDQPRSVSKYGDDEKYRYESATMLATMTFLQKGIPFIYQGQEIGVPNFKGENIEQFRDIETINYFNENKDKIEINELMYGINYASRDNARRPMPWSGEEYSGFSTVKPWIDEYDSFREVNVECDINSPKSIYRFYQELFKLRASNDAFINGTYEDITGDTKNAYIYKRSINGCEYVVICNFERENEINLDICGEVVLSNSGRNTVSGVYSPYECAVILLK